MGIIFQNDRESVAVDAAVALPTPETPKVKGKQAIIPSYLKTAKPNPKNPLTRDERNTANLDITTLRTSQTTRETIRQFIKVSPDLSAAVTSYIRTGITSGYIAVAKNPDGTFNSEATGALAQVITRMNILSDYSAGFDDALSIRSVCEVWAKEILTYGEMAGELVLDKARLPDKIQPVNVGQILKFPSSDGKRMLPVQRLAGVDVDLDVPTFFMVGLDQDLLTPYGDSPIEPALQAVLFSAEFMNDIRRIVKKAIHPRYDVTIDYEKFIKQMPPEVQMDQSKAIEYMNTVVQDLQDLIAGLNPEDAIVHFDAIGVEVIDHGNTNLSNEYEALQGMADAKLATGAKVLPTVLGHAGGTSNTASAEVLMFLKYVEGTVWGKLNEMLSKIFTLAVRLLGYDVYVEFQFNEIDLKPSSELESFKAQKQSRILELLSLGLMTDEAASIALTGQLPPAGMKALSGTGFMAAKADPNANNYNGSSNSGSTLNQKIAPDTPTGGPRGSNKKAEVLPMRAQ